ncbi:MAG: head GIN domain-containing protein [bacterium]
MKKVLILTVFALLALGFSACWEFDFESGNGKIETYNVAITESYTKVEVRGSGNINIEKGEPKDVVVQIDENLREHLEMYVHNGTLIIDLNNSSPTKCEINLSMPSLAGINLSGSADVRAEGYFELPAVFEVNLSGSGDIYIKEMNADRVNVDLTGSGDAKIYGTTKDLYIDLTGSGDAQFIGKSDFTNVLVTGSGDANLDNSESTNANVQISGSGNVKIYVMKKLDASISGSGNIYLYHEPETLNSHVSGSGEIVHVK